MKNPSSSPLTTFEVSRLLHVDLTTVIHWCDQGKLTAYKTPGGHRRVAPESLSAFLKQYAMPVPAALQEQLQGKIRILVVDDEREIRRVVSKAFRKNLPSAEVYEAEDGFEAGKAILDKVPHLVILDLHLPGVDGFKVCANIKSDERLKDIKILAITGKAVAENEEKILKAGADDFLAKPFEVKDLMAQAFDLLGIQKSAEEGVLA